MKYTRYPEWFDPTPNKNFKYILDPRYMNHGIKYFYNDTLNGWLVHYVPVDQDSFSRKIWINEMFVGNTEEEAIDFIENHLE